MAHEAKLTIREAAAYTGFPTSTIGHAAKLDPPRLRSYKAGPNGPYYFTKSHLDEWVRSMETAPADAPQQPAKKRRTRQKVNN
jgi:hypothetical protein